MAKRKFQSADQIKVGVIGYGGTFNMGKHHLAEMKQVGLSPVAVAELDQSRLAVAATDFPGIQTYTKVADMLKKSDVNLITIITPHNTHAKLALQCLNAGKHVVCEKPLAITTAECDRMIAAAKKNGVMLSTYHNRHWDGWIMQAVREVKQEQVIGDIVRVEARMGGYAKPKDIWRACKSVSGGVLYDWGVHLLEYTLQLIESDIVEVSAYNHTGFWGPRTKWKQDTNEDEAFLVVRYKSGQWSTLRVTTIDASPKPGQLEITGTLGSYVVEFGSRTIHKVVDGQTITTKGPTPKAEGHRLYQNIADHLTKGEKLIITAEYARRPIHILDLADQSARKGMALRAKYK